MQSSGSGRLCPRAGGKGGRKRRGLQVSPSERRLGVKGSRAGGPVWEGRPPLASSMPPLSLRLSISTMGVSQEP